MSLRDIWIAEDMTACDAMPSCHLCPDADTCCFAEDDSFERVTL